MVEPGIVDVAEMVPGEIDVGAPVMTKDTKGREVTIVEPFASSPVVETPIL